MNEQELREKLNHIKDDPYLMEDEIPEVVRKRVDMTLDSILRKRNSYFKIFRNSIIAAVCVLSFTFLFRVALPAFAIDPPQAKEQTFLINKTVEDVGYKFTILSVTEADSGCVINYSLTADNGFNDSDPLKTDNIKVQTDGEDATFNLKCIKDGDNYSGTIQVDNIKNKVNLMINQIDGSNGNWNLIENFTN